jgi:predicted component of type VI protein secretion system
MVLTLEITSAQAASLGSASRHVFSSEGGTIGRAGSSDWILSHRKVSGRHAVISFHENVFYIVDDSSANGVFINTTKNRLIPGKRYALKAGDRIIIDPYEIDVSISAEHGSGSRRQVHEFSDPPVSNSDAYNPFDVVDPFAQGPARTPHPYPTPPAKHVPAGEVVPADELDPLKLLGGTPKPTPAQPARTAKDLENASPLAGHYRPPAVPTPPPSVPVVQPNPNMIPADYDPLSDEPDEPLPIPPIEPPRISIPPETPPQRPTPPPATPIPAARPHVVVEPERVAPRETPAPAPVPRGDTSDPGLVAVLQGAGLESAPVTAEFARSFGEIFRVVVAGVMDVLRARQQIKDEFRMRLTQFRAADNNPLKFSANVDDALHNLLVKRNAAYLEPVEAFEDAFDDLRDHQIAMLAGMRVAFESMLAHFNPDQLQGHFDRQLKRSALTSMTARLRYWELYRDRFEEMSKDTESTFRRLFGEEFAKAYEEQLKRLKADRRANAAILRPPDE